MENKLAAIGEGILGGMNFYRAVKVDEAKRKLEERQVAVQETQAETARLGVTQQASLIEIAKKLDREAQTQAEKAAHALSTAHDENSRLMLLWQLGSNEQSLEKSLKNALDQDRLRNAGAVTVANIQGQTAKDIALSGLEADKQTQERLFNFEKSMTPLRSQLEAGQALTVGAMNYMLKGTLDNYIERWNKSATMGDGPVKVKMQKQLLDGMKGLVGQLNKVTKAGTSDDVFDPILKPYEQDISDLQGKLSTSYPQWLQANPDFVRDPVLGDIRWLMMTGGMADPMGGMSTAGAFAPKAPAVPQASSNMVGRGVQQTPFGGLPKARF